MAAIEHVKEITGKNFVTQTGYVLESVFGDAVEEYLAVVETGNYEQIKDFCVSTGVAVKTAQNILDLAILLNEGKITHDLSVLSSSLYKTIEGQSEKIVTLTKPVPVTGSAKYDWYQSNMDWFRILVTSVLSKAFGLPNKYKKEEDNFKNLVAVSTGYDSTESKKFIKKIMKSRAVNNSLFTAVCVAVPMATVGLLTANPVGAYWGTLVFSVLTIPVVFWASFEDNLAFKTKKQKIKRFIPLPVLGEKQVKSIFDNFNNFIEPATGSMKSYLLQLAK